jgi:hypothetical protein
MAILRWVTKTTRGRELVCYSATVLGAREKLKGILQKGERLVGPMVTEEPASTLRVEDRRKTS